MSGIASEANEVGTDIDGGVTSDNAGRGAEGER